MQVYDYVDAQIPVLSRMFEKRLRGYRSMGYTESSILETSAQIDQRRIEYDEVE